MGKVLILITSSYKKYLSPIVEMLGVGNCRFSPTCSEYCLLAIKKYGAAKGMFLTLKRFGRCQPFGGFGPDTP